MAADFDSNKDEMNESGLNEETRYFHPLRLGKSFRKLATDIVKGDKTDVVSRWFRSEIADCDLAIWTDSEGRIIKHQTCIYGQVFEWTAIEGTRTGYIFEEEVAGGEELEIIRFDRAVDQIAIEKAAQVLAHIPGLTDKEREEMIYHLKQSPRLHKKARERALETWSLNGADLVSENRPSFWKTIRSWLQKR